MDRHQHTRSLAAGLFASAAAPVIAFCLFGLAHDLSDGQQPHMYTLVIIFGLAVSLPSAFLLGAPLVLLLRRFRLLNGYLVCFGAMIIGILAMTAFGFLFSYDTGLRLDKTALAARAARASIVPGLLFGLVSGVAMSLASGITWKPRG